MANLCVLTVIDQSHDTKRAEVQLIDRAFQLAAQQIRSQKVVPSGNVLGDRGTLIATWVYTGSATNNG
jgi:hypothetical protein